MENKFTGIFLGFLLMMFFVSITGLHLVIAQETTTDYTSKVPKYTFATSLEEQEKQLETNPLMLRFAASRKKLAGDPYRPIYHYVNPLRF